MPTRIQGLKPNREYLTDFVTNYHTKNNIPEPKTVIIRRTFKGLDEPF